MSKPKEWWKAWSPFWEYMEDSHMSIAVTESIIYDIASPVLVIGAGQGLVVNYLQKKGFTVDGLDLEKEMIEQAKSRHSINLIHGDAKNLPFKDKKYKTVIISSGVVDYITDKELIKQIINEALRVTALRGNLFIAYYKIHPVIEKVYKELGVIDSSKNLHRKRMFDIDKIARKNPLNCISSIMKWTNKKYLPTLVHWTKLGLTLPKEIKTERKKMDFIFDLAKKKNIDVKDLYDSIPDNIPYREENDIAVLLKELEFNFNRINIYNDCVLVNIYKSGLTNFDHSVKERRKETKNWIVKIKNITKAYKGAKKKAVDSISISIEKGSIFGLLGPNGAGKTTILSILCGLLKPDKGEVLFSEDIDPKNIQKIIGYVPQELAFYPRLTGKENLMFFGRLYDIPKKELKNRIEELLRIVGLQERANDQIRRYSTGMKRRLNLVAGLINNPKIVFMDEPTVGIDPQSRNRIFDLLFNLKKKGVTILYTTHYMEEVSKLCDHIGIIDGGKILMEGNPGALVRKYGVYTIKFELKNRSPKDFVLQLSSIKSILEVDIKDGFLFVLFENKIGIIEIIEQIKKVANKFKLKISLINIVEPSLEGLFLDITGRSLRDSFEDGGDERIFE